MMDNNTLPSDKEKHSGIVEHVDKNYDLAVMEESESDDHGFSLEEQRAIIRRIDRRLVVTVGVIYCVNFMDRTNMSVANIAGMSTDLNLIGNRYVSPTSSSSWSKCLTARHL